MLVDKNYYTLIDLDQHNKTDHACNVKHVICQRHQDFNIPSFLFTLIHRYSFALIVKCISETDVINYYKVSVQCVY